MKRYSIESELAVEADVEAAFDWYEVEEVGLGSQFLEELRSAYQRILDNPNGYQELRFGTSPRPNSSVSLRRLFLY